jgi:hypothetical protein
MKLLITSALVTICFTATGQNLFPKKALTLYPGTYIDTEYRYTDSTGIAVIIQNSVRKGGPYIDPNGKDFFSVIFWYRVINETSTPLELTIKFPADSITTTTTPDSYLKVFLPPDIMTLGKETLYSYGVTGLKAFLDAGLNKPTMLQRTINPNEATLFYISVLYHYQATPSAHAELVLKEQELFYQNGGIEIPCGKIVFKD